MNLGKHVTIGVIAGVLLFLVYLGILALTQGIDHAFDQTARLWYWMAALITGFGVQVGLFSFIRQALHEKRASATASVATSGGVSAGSMVACCAHHLSDVLPLIGLAGLGAFLADYQLLFIILGVLSNIVGITIMLETIQRHGLSPRVGSWRWNMTQVKRFTIISTAVIFLVTTITTLL